MRFNRVSTCSKTIIGQGDREKIYDFIRNITSVSSENLKFRIIDCKGGSKLLEIIEGKPRSTSISIIINNIIRAY